MERESLPPGVEETGAPEHEPEATPILDEGTWELIRQTAREMGLPEEEEVQRTKQAYAEYLQRYPDLEDRRRRLKEELRQRVQEIVRELAD